MTTDAEIIVPAEGPIASSTPDLAPSPWALVAAVLAGSFWTTLVGLAIAQTLTANTFMATYRSNGPNYSGLFVTAMIGAVPVIMAVLLTRRSSTLITVATATLATILLSKGQMYGFTWILGAASMAFFVWLACTRSSMKSFDERRRPGESMPLGIPSQMIKVGLISFVLVAIALMVVMGPLAPFLVMMIIPISYTLFIAWIAAVLCDGFGTKIARNAIAKNTPTV